MQNKNPYVRRIYRSSCWRLHQKAGSGFLMLNKIIRFCLFYSDTRWCPQCIAFDSRIYWYQGQKVRNLTQACLQEDFWSWDLPKTWVSSHFSKKNERIANVFEDCESTKYGTIRYQRGQNTFWPQHHILREGTVWRLLVEHFLLCSKKGSLPE